MKTFKIRFWVTVAFLGLAVQARAQDPAFSQFFNTPFQTNPGMLSIRPEMMIGANFRTQWSGLGVPYTTYLLNGYYPILSKNKQDQLGAGGGYILVDRKPAGSLNTTAFGIAGSYKLPVNFDNYFHCGIQLGYMSRSISQDGLSTGSQVANGYYNPNLPINEASLGESRGAPTIGLGTTWVNEDVDGDTRASLGVAAYHLNGPNISFYDNGIDNIKRSYIFSGSLRAVKTTQLSFIPSFRFAIQGPARLFTGGGIVRFPLAAKAGRGPISQGGKNTSSLGFGLFYQPADASAIIGMVEYARSDYSVSINYDLGVGSLKDGTRRGNAVEFFIAYRKTLGKKRKADLRYFDIKKAREVGPGNNPITPQEPTQPTTQPQGPKTEQAPPQQAPAPRSAAPAQESAPAPAAEPKSSVNNLKFATPPQRSTKAPATQGGSGTKATPKGAPKVAPKKVAPKPTGKQPTAKAQSQGASKNKPASKAKPAGKKPAKRK